MLSFCPYEVIGDQFRPLEMDKLVYEIVFMDDFSIEDLKSTVISEAVNNEIIKQGTDGVLEENYKDSAEHFMLLNKYDGNDKSGLEQLIEMINKGNSVEKSRSQNNQGRMGNGKLSCNKNEKDGSYMVRIAKDAGVMERDVFQIFPCCPSCHHRLPVGWLTADEFHGISLLAKTKGGKTTMLTSLMVENWSWLRGLHDNLTIVSANHRDDPAYKKMVEAAKKLRDNKECPEGTVTEFLIAPLFLKVIWRNGNKRHSFIVGIYDNSGEVLADMNIGDIQLRILPHMDAHIYIIEPKQVAAFEIVREKENYEELKNLKLMSIEAQGKMQQDCVTSVTGQQLLEQMKEHNAYENPFLMYTNLQEEMIKREVYEERMNNQHICCTLVKSDLIEKHVMREIRGSGVLFSKEAKVDYFDEDGMLTISKHTKKIFDRFVFPGLTYSIANFATQFKSVSYHCISSLGCDTEEIGPAKYVLKGTLEPIRVAEPIVTCIKNIIEENGWM